MTNDGLIGKLVADLRPIHPRSIGIELLLVGVAGLLELVLYLAAGTARPDMGTAITHFSFWWKLTSLAMIAATGVIFAVHSFDPSNSSKERLRWLAALASISLGVGWALSVTSGAAAPLLARLRWQDGLACMVTVVALSTPVLALLTFFMRKAAPVDGRSSALIVGAAGAAWGAFVFAFHCNHDDPLYIAAWYGGAVGLIALLARALLSRLTRW